MYVASKEEEKESSSFFHKPQRQYINTVYRFKSITRFYGLMKIGFAIVVSIECLLSFICFSLFSWTPVLAVLLALIFLTIFTYLILTFYFQTKKNEQLRNLKERFLQACRQLLSIPEKTAEHHLSIAQATYRLAQHLHEQEFRYFVLPPFLSFFNQPLEKLSFWLFHEDVFFMKEQLFLSGIEEHLIQIRLTPTDLEVHASLANIYISLAKLYKEVQEETMYAQLNKKIGKLIEEKFKIASVRSIEELKILNEFAPNDPWVHAQLARCYRSLKRTSEEAKEYETILKISPNDFEVLFRLGVAYFELGENAKGLEIYEKLKSDAHKKAEQLLTYYGAMQDQNLLYEETF